MWMTQDLKTDIKKYYIESKKSEYKNEEQSEIDEEITKYSLEDNRIAEQLNKIIRESSKTQYCTNP